MLDIEKIDNMLNEAKETQNTEVENLINEIDAEVENKNKEGQNMNENVEEYVNAEIPAPAEPAVVEKEPETTSETTDSEAVVGPEVQGVDVEPVVVEAEVPKMAEPAVVEKEPETTEETMDRETIVGPEIEAEDVEPVLVEEIEAPDIPAPVGPEEPEDKTDVAIKVEDIHTDIKAEDIPDGEPVVSDEVVGTVEDEFDVNAETPAEITDKEALCARSESDEVEPVVVEAEISEDTLEIEPEVADSAAEFDTDINDKTVADIIVNKDDIAKVEELDTEENEEDAEVELKTPLDSEVAEVKDVVEDESKPEPVVQESNVDAEFAEIFSILKEMKEIEIPSPSDSLEVAKEMMDDSHEKETTEVEDSEVSDEVIGTEVEAEDVEPVVVEAEVPKMAEPAVVEKKPETTEETMDREAVVGPEVEAEDVEPVVVESEKTEEIAKAISEAENEEEIEKIVDSLSESELEFVASEDFNKTEELSENENDVCFYTKEKEQEDVFEEIDLAQDKERFAECCDKKEVKYKNLKEAFLLDQNYFNEDSVSVLTAGEKNQKLIEQVALLISKESDDGLYKALVENAQNIVSLKEAIIEKYKVLAEEKAGMIKESLEVKEEKDDE